MMKRGVDLIKKKDRSSPYLQIPPSSIWYIKFGFPNKVRSHVLLHQGSKASQETEKSENSGLGKKTQAPKKVGPVNLKVLV